MKLNNISFPHPVLGINDDVFPLPECPLAGAPQKENGSFIFQFTLNVENEDLLNLVTAGKARYACDVNCPSTLFRKCFIFDKLEISMEIPEADLAGKMSFQFFIMAQEKFDYVNQGFHEDYAGSSFEVDKGDILAYLGEASYDVDLDYEHIGKVGAFMEIAKGENKQVDVDYEGEKIIIRLPVIMYEQYRQNIVGNKHFGNIIHSSLVMNALTQALMNYKENMASLWARTLERRFKTEPPLQAYQDALENQDFNEICKLASELLHYPYERMFDSLKSLGNLQEEEES